MQIKNPFRYLKRGIKINFYLDLVSYNRLFGVDTVLPNLQLHFLSGFVSGQLHFLVREVLHPQFLFCAVVLVRFPSFAEQPLVLVPVLNFAEHALVLVPQALVDALIFTPTFCLAQQFFVLDFVVEPEHAFVFVEQFLVLVELDFAEHPRVLALALQDLTLLEPHAFCFVAIIYLLK